MKIDSPTFLTETTFISSSVQFSSGSQKFGNTSDDIHQFTGSIRLGGNSTGLRVDDGHVRAGRDLMLGSSDNLGGYTNRNTNISMYYGTGGQAGYIYFQKNGVGTQYELAGNETAFNIF